MQKNQALVRSGRRVREALALSRFPLRLYHFFLSPCFSKLCPETGPHILGGARSFVLPPSLPQLSPFDLAPKLCCCFLKLQFSKQAGRRVCELRQQTSSSKYFIRANTFNLVLGPRNFTFGHEMSVPTKGPLRPRE